MNELIEKLLFDGKRFTSFGTDDNTYRFDKLIFNIFIVICLALFLIVFFSNGADKSWHTHYVCSKSSGVCVNPFFENYPSCSEMWATACVDQFVVAGFEYGTPKPFIVDNFSIILAVLLGLAFFINHLLYNQDFKFQKFDEGGS